MYNRGGAPLPEVEHSNPHQVLLGAPAFETLNIFNRKQNVSFHKRENNEMQMAPEIN